MSNRQIRMPYNTFVASSEVNPATVRRIVARFVEHYPSGSGFDIRAADRALESAGYLAKVIKSDGCAQPFTGLVMLVTRSTTL
jgi:hypothetical protein